jgi:diguanylate cyclase
MPRRIVVRDDNQQDHDGFAIRTLISEFRHAVQTDQLVLHYQPKATLISGRVEAVEALVRWHHPKLGLLYPDRFLPLIEQSDLIDELTKWVLRQSVDDLRDLGVRAEHLKLAVNISARNLSHPGFTDLVERSLARAQIPSSRLVLEVAETALLSDPAGGRTVLARLDALGVNVSIDDFGCSQTGLGFLSTLPVHELKIDRSFIGDMLVDPAHAAMVRSIVDLGHTLRLRVVAEGVESDVVWEILRALGCDSAQGYVLARPMAVDHLGHWLENAAHESHGLVENSVIEGNGVFAEYG